MVDFSQFEEEVNAEFDRLVEVGAITFTGEFDEDGDAIYIFDAEIMKREAPELWQEHLDEVDRTLLELAEKGLISLDFSNPEIGVSVTEYGEEVFRSINST